MIYSTKESRAESLLRKIRNSAKEINEAVEKLEKAQLSQEDATSDTIDRQAVIKVLECWQKAFKENSHHASASDLSLVVKDIRALSATHVATNINVGGTISRQAAVELVMKYCPDDDGAVQCDGDIRGLLDELENLPSAQPETAKRIVGKSRDGMTLWYQCDMCNEPVDAQDNYCRGCGRRLIDG